MARPVARFDRHRSRRTAEFGQCPRGDRQGQVDGGVAVRDPAGVQLRARAEQVWQALTDADLTARYWGHANVSDWQPGSAWEHRRVDGSGVVDVVGRVIKTEPPARLVPRRD